MSKAPKTSLDGLGWHWIVCDNIGNVSYSPKTEGPETFRTYTAARKRAEGIARLNPGDQIYIYEAVGVANASVNEVEIGRKYPQLTHDERVKA